MEKISRILPPSARTKTAEISSSQPARPGAPEAGRVQGSLTTSPFASVDRVSLSSELEDSMLNPQTYNKDKRHTQIAKKIAEDFFTKRSETTADTGLKPQESVPVEVKPNTTASGPREELEAPV